MRVRRHARPAHTYTLTYIHTLEFVNITLYSRSISASGKGGRSVHNTSAGYIRYTDKVTKFNYVLAYHERGRLFLKTNLISTGCRSKDFVNETLFLAIEIRK